MAAPAGRRIPVWRTVVDAYAVTFSNLGYLAQISWAWVLLTILIHIAFNYADILLEWQTAPEAWVRVFYVLASWLIMTPLAASIYVAWHRLLLRDESWPCAWYLRFDKIVVRYLVPSAAMSLIMFGPLLVVMAVWKPDATEDPPDFLVPIVFAALIFGYLLTTKVWLILPARALERPLTFQNAWTAAGGNLLRLAVGAQIALLPAWILIFLLAWADYPALLQDRPAVRLVAEALEDVVLGCLLVMPMVSFLSLAYRELLERVDWTDR
ncbi:MAG: hypothetical protein ACKVP3_02510 [Hyphomicrobiaceae bacterium]